MVPKTRSVTDARWGKRMCGIFEEKKIFWIEVERLRKGRRERRNRLNM